MTVQGEQNEASLEAERKRRIAEQEARIRAMQSEQIPVEGGAPKGRVGLVSAYVVSTLAMILPLRLRTAFTFGLNFVYNQLGATLRLLIAWLGRAALGVGITIVYFAIIGPTALLVRLFGKDELHSPLVNGSYFTDKEPADVGEERFLRQY